MKRFLWLVIAVVAVLAFRHVANDRAAPPLQDTRTPAATPADRPGRNDDALFAAIGDRRSGVQVAGEGRVSRILADDDDGSRHQRFILELSSGDTLLVAHNIDLAPRVAGLQVGDSVAFSGQYEWNDRGGVLHWTHHDPAGRHPDGWLRHDGRTYR